MPKYPIRNVQRTIVLSILIISTITGFFIFSDLSLNNENSEELNLKNDTPSELNKIKASSDWWNSSFKYRKQFNLTNSSPYNRTNEPVDKFFTFSSGECHKDSIRVVQNTTGNGKELPYQLWNITMYDSIYIQECTITFLASILNNSRVVYYLYYSDDNDEGKILNPKQKYLDNSGFSSTLVNDKVTIKTNEMNIEIESGRGVYNLSKKDGGKNYHTNNSLAPWKKNANINQTQTTVYHPDSEGFILNWLIVGPFDRGTAPWPASPQYNVHLDITKEYVLGDYATGGNHSLDADPKNDDWEDPTKQWEYYDFSTVPGYPQTGWEGYNDVSYYYQDVKKVSYLTCYVRSPVTLDDAYLGIGSNEGIRIWQDGIELDYFFFQSDPPYPDDYQTPVTLEKDTWHYFLVELLNNQHQNDWGFYFRFVNNSDLVNITNLDIAMQPTLPVIKGISEPTDTNKVGGPIFSKYLIEWQDDDDMKITDEITVYNNYTMWKTVRKFWWANEQENISFSILNTFYNDSSKAFDDYFYDGTYERGKDSPPQSQNYTVIRENNAGEQNMSIGIFISDIEKGNPSIRLNDIFWANNYTSSGTQNIFNLRPGNKTDLYIPPHDPTDTDYYVKISFWEYFNKTWGSVDDLNNTFKGIYNSVTNIVSQTPTKEVEAAEFDLTVNVTNIEGYVFEGVNVSISNSSLTSRKIRLNQTSNMNGLTTFSNLPNGTYLIECNYTKYGKTINVKKNYEVIVNESKTIKIYINLTSLHLTLYLWGDPNEKVEGADVEFYENTTGGESLIGIESSSSEGIVTFVWENTSASVANISVRVKLAGDYKLINYTCDSPVSYINDSRSKLNFTFYERTEYDISVKVFAGGGSYNFSIEVLTSSPVENKYFGQYINVSYRYYWENTSDPNIPKTQNNITTANLTYTIRDDLYGTILVSGQILDKTSLLGEYNISLDTSNASYNLECGPTYEFSFTAQKSGGYGLVQGEIKFVLQEITTDLTTQDSNIQVRWNNNFSILVSYKDTLNGDIGVNESQVTYNVPGGVSGNLIEKSTPGEYYLTLNSTSLSEIGNHYMSIRAYKVNYEFRQINIKIVVSEILTSLIESESEISKTWKQIFSISVTYRDTDNKVPITDATVSYQALGTINPIEGTILHKGDGVYTLSPLSTEDFLYAGTYSLRINATKPNYQQKSVDIILRIFAINTQINGSHSLNENYKIPIWKSKMFYFNYTTEDDAPVNGAITAQCEWDKENINGKLVDSGVVYLEELGWGIYKLDFDTKTLNISTYTLVITLGKTNYIERTATIILEVLPREINTKLSQEFKDNVITVYTGDPLDFSVKLTDATNDIKLADAKVKITFQDNIYTFSESSNGLYLINITNYLNLTENDISNTSTAPIVIKKANYYSKTVLITIVLENKRFNTTLSEQFSEQIITVVSGDQLSFTITLNNSKDNSPLIGAEIYIKFEGELYEAAEIIDNEDGTYTITFDSLPETFFVSQAHPAEFVIKSDNYKTETIPITIMVTMDEIFPGVPTFFFILIVSSIVAVITSLITYRVFQQARIPKFVKHARKFKQYIKDGKEIPDKLLFPSKDKFIVKNFGSHWEELGISLEDIWIERKKTTKKLPDKKESSKPLPEKEKEIDKPEGGNE